MNAAPPWWTPVMQDIKAMMEACLGVHPLLWEFIRSVVADAVRVELIGYDLPQKAARKAVLGLLLVIFEELQKPAHEQNVNAMIEKLAALEAS